MGLVRLGKGSRTLGFEKGAENGKGWVSKTESILPHCPP